MSGIGENIKAGLKGVRGAGDVIRGEFLDAADRTFDNPNHPATTENSGKNRVIAEHGRQDLRNMDETFAANEWQRKDAKAKATSAPTTATTSTAPTATEGTAGTGVAAHSTGAPPLPERGTGTSAGTAAPRENLV